MLSKIKNTKIVLSKRILVLSIFVSFASEPLVIAETHEHHHIEIERNDNKDQETHADIQENKENEHEHDQNGHEENNLVKMSLEQQQMAGIKVEIIVPQEQIDQMISAPGEVVNDLYNTTLLTTQVDSKVISRHVVLGQHIEKGDLIAVLYSLDLATAQNQLKVASSEWQRVKKLGKKIVGEKRHITTKAEFEKNKSLLLAYGFNEDLIQKQLTGKTGYNTGQYPVLAPHDGVILEDNFQSGQFLSAGSTIALLVNEDDVWVEALLAPEIGQRIPVGTQARVVISNTSFNAKVIHDSHAIDKVTRTRKIRLLIRNHDHLLHAGLFATVFLELPLSDNVILLPETALMRSSNGDWTVFIEQETDVFVQKEVELENSINALHRIKGLKAGQRVVTEGAFFLASELAKGGFDPHNH